MNGVLFPVDVVRVHQAKPYNSADAPIFVAGADSQDYVAKLASTENPCLPLAEAFSHYLCGRIGIAVPATTPLKFPDGRLAFGSRFESGVTQFTQLDLAARISALASCGTQVHALCLLDAFSANPDRHPDNLLFRVSPFDGRWTVLGMDFSRAFWRGGFPRTHAHTIFSQGNTAALAQLIKRVCSLEDRTVAMLVASLQAITPEQVAIW